MSGADCACEKVKMTNTRTSITRRTLSFIRSVTFLRIWWMFQVLLILLCLPAGLCKNYCITQETFDNVVPQFGKDAGTFTLQPEISPPGVHFPLDVKDVISQCVKICCQEDTCDAVYVFEGSCYTLDCVSREACMPIEGKVQGTHMAFIARASPSFSQESFVEPRNLNSECDPKTHQPCPQNEECIGVTGKKGNVNYQCQCVEGYERDSSDACIASNPSVASASTKPISSNDLPDRSELPQSTSFSLQTESESHLTPRSQEEAVEQNVTAETKPSNDDVPQVTAAVDHTQEEVIPNPSKKNKQHSDDDGSASPTVTEAVPVDINETEETGNETDTDIVHTEAVTDQPPHVTTKVVTEPVVVLSVSAGDDKVLHLPDEDSVSLFVYVVPEPPENTKYQYEWTLVAAPEGSTAGVMEGKHQKRCNLSKLTAGQYMFKVTVTGDHAYGEDNVNVTVLPKPRVNEPPVAVISPKKQEVTLPNSETVLDGSQSTDDDEIVSYHWEEIKGPLREQKTIGDEALLTMTDLVAGIYIIQLTVTDSDGVTSSATANVTVHEEVDYPPVANAGTNRVVKLPKNSVVLNGSLSSDDKGIAQYEWSKDSGGVADMQGTSSKILHLSNLEEGVYVFTLKVTDTAGHDNSASVTVIVQPENNSPPVADAGPDKEISLPNDETELDGSQSSDDQGITSYSWTKQSGPSDVDIKNDDKAKATISDLRPGTYVFSLTVTDAKGTSDTDTVSVVVKQEVNEPPVANAGEDFTVLLPRKYVEVDGRKSHDDMAIVSYEWTRNSKSPAAGEILSGSDREAILKLTNLVVGRYTFTLKVTDAKNLHDSDSVSLEVQEDPNKVNLVEIHIIADIRTFTQGNKDALVRQLSVLIGVMDADIKVQSVRESPLGGVVLEFYVLSADGTKVLKGISIVNKLRQKLHKESQVLDFHVVRVDTVVCQNDCSGHGSCNVETKECVCESFWMENFFRIYLGDGESNCEWSILYVVIIISLIVVTLGVLIWAVVCCIKRRRVKIRKRHRYSILDDFDEGESLEMLPKSKNGKHNSSIMISESDTDEDTLYETKKSNGYKPNRPRPLNGLIAARKNNKRKDSRSLKPLLQQQSINQSESL
ncbi:dyslexia-associated protein KIAA0319-like isoform X2 [Ptychodera flava]|uniref:dyslexia-associated protein KIAA0319-like isoform X2 n=1 Tax=Ptychodera flava TaxID=63121 RepID=UPI003969E19E